MSKASANFPGYRTTGIYANHIEMTKFKDVEDLGFLAVTAELRRWSKPFQPQNISHGKELEGIRPLELHEGESELTYHSIVEGE